MLDKTIESGNVLNLGCFGYKNGEGFKQLSPSFFVEKSFRKDFTYMYTYAIIRT